MINLSRKKASILHQVITHIIVIGLVFGLFFLATMAKANSRGVKQQVLEKELALLIDEGIPGMDFYVSKTNLAGVVNKVFIGNNRIFVYVDNLAMSKGYPYFTKYKVDVEGTQEGFFIRIR